MNKRIAKKLFKQKLYGLKDNDYIIMEFDLNEIKFNMAYNFFKTLDNIKGYKNRCFLLPNSLTVQSMSKEQVRQIIDKLTEIVGD